MRRYGRLRIISSSGSLGSRRVPTRSTFDGRRSFVLRLSLLGGAGLSRASVSTGPLTLRTHGLALLALLATAPSRRRTRAKVMGLMWPEMDEASARNRLNTCVFNLRSVAGPEVVESAGADLRLNAGVVRCDVWAFEEALERGEYDRAAASYTGPFLDGFYLKGNATFDHWSERQRARLEASHREVLIALAEVAEARSDAESAVRWWRRLRDENPYDAHVTCRLMEALASAGRRAEALHIASDHARSMSEELDAEPDADVELLAARLRDGAPQRAARSAGRSAAPPGRADRVGAPRPGRNERDSNALKETSGLERSQSGERRPQRTLIAAGLLTALAAGIGGYLSTAEPSPASEARSRAIAVLPFAALGEEDPGELGEGLHADLLTRLARIPGLTVVSSTSVQRYRGTEERLSEIARDLGVQWILEGAVQRAGGGVQVNAQLIDARTDAHVWAERYRRTLTADGLFEVQAELTRRIARALEANLTGADERRLGRRPTGDLRAYDYFLRGRAYQTRSPGRLSAAREDHRAALQLFDRAVERDSGFAEAWARKSESHLALYQLSGREAAEELDRARSAARRARIVDTNGPWGDFATAEIARRVDGDLDRALEHYEATGLASSEVLVGRAKVLEAQGRLAPAIPLYEHARVLDPLNPDVSFQSWTAYASLGRYDEAAAVLERVLEIAPDHRAARWQRAMMPLYASGDAAAVTRPADQSLLLRWWRGDHAGALAVEAGSPVPAVELPFRVYRGLLLRERGDTAAATQSLQAARTELESITGRDPDPRLLGALALAYAGLGEGAAALETARRGIAEAAEAMAVGEARLVLASVQTLIGAEEQAIATLDAYLANPGIKSLGYVAGHPLLRPLRDHPDFAELARRYGT